MALRGLWGSWRAFPCAMRAGRGPLQGCDEPAESLMGRADQLGAGHAVEKLQQDSSPSCAGGEERVGTKSAADTNMTARPTTEN